MFDPDFKKICIIGVGLIGGSLGGVLKEKWSREIEVIGLGRREESLRKALQRGLIDRYSLSPQEALDGVDLVVLATPVGQYRAVLQGIRDFLDSSTVVTDVGSVKAEVFSIVREVLPEEIPFVGAHPIAGSEKAGPENARTDLFEGSLCIITPDKRTPSGPLRRVEALWRAVGAKVVIMDPEVHDRVFALVSHLPHVLSYGLVRAVKDFMPEAMEYAGTGFRDTTRIAKSPAHLWADICHHNRVHLIEALEAFIKEISDMLAILKRDDIEALEKVFAEGAELRRSLGDDC